jgi:DNA-binding transcriptional ArsR family regulator
MKQRTHVLNAISHPTRRAIIGMASGPARFLDIAEPFDVALNAVTKHLKLLERAGLIEREKRGREVSGLPDTDGGRSHDKGWNYFLDIFPGQFTDASRKNK